jgi:hypothetical protein
MENGANILVIGEDPLRQRLRLGDNDDRRDDEQNGYGQSDEDRK